MKARYFEVQYHIRVSHNAGEFIRCAEEGGGEGKPSVNYTRRRTNGTEMRIHEIKNNAALTPGK